MIIEQTSGRRRPRLAGALAGTLLVGVLVIATPAAGAGAGPWPPADQPGTLFAHYGEEHINDEDGATLLPKVVHEVIRYGPAMVTMSGDKANDGEPEQFELWLDVIKKYDRAGIPWFAGVGNHDRDVPGSVEASGGLPFVNLEFGPYREFFADHPYPMGDARPYPGAEISPDSRPSDDPEGAASHYFVDYGKVRWVFIDNSCWSIVACDPFQYPSAQNLDGSEGQLTFLRRVGAAASDRDRMVFVVMHMPTRDPADQSYREPIAQEHTMGKTYLGLLDNKNFEQAAADAGVDGVFAGHIKGQFLYDGLGGIPYFIDGGAGGELYTTGPVGVDHGYWHGFRLVNVQGDSFTTDAVPIFEPGGITITGPQRVESGRRVTFRAFGKQPVYNDPAKVEALELRDPDPIPPAESGAFAWVGDIAPWVGPPLAVLALLALTSTVARRRRLALPALALVGAVGFAGVSAARDAELTTTPVENLPNPARMWTSSNPEVLAPVASDSDDPRRNRRTQTADGRFRAVCPGITRVTIASGYETATHRVRVMYGPATPSRCAVPTPPAAGSETERP